jgi:hypothetical protein
MIQRSNLIHQSAYIGEQTQEPTKAEIEAMIAMINHEAQRLSWDKQRLRQVAVDRYGKNAFAELTGAEMLDLYQFLATREGLN